MTTLLVVLAMIVVVAFFSAIVTVMVRQEGVRVTLGIWAASFAVSAAMVTIILYATGELA